MWILKFLPLSWFFVLHFLFLCVCLSVWLCVLSQWVSPVCCYPPVFCVYIVCVLPFSFVILSFVKHSHIFSTVFLCFSRSAWFLDHCGFCFCLLPSGFVGLGFGLLACFNPCLLHLTLTLYAFWLKPSNRTCLSVFSASLLFLFCCFSPKVLCT